MTVKRAKSVRCAIYTRKSTEHGLELEFNSLDAQREACEAYIKSQVHDGWTALPARYDDPAYSGGNLERPALQKLLRDIDAGSIDVVVVYKIDRLTRSLADFAKLVEAFDKKAISFVAVTQQFNTTTSMGRLTLNVLLSFAQFERELSSERVRDKVAASRKKGKWTGGGIPLGYDVKDKKLVVNQSEADTVRFIYRSYLDLKCLRRLKAELDEKKIVSKRRTNSFGRNPGGVRLTYGPLAYLLKNRTYLGEMGHKGSWFPGEHDAIIDPALFDEVQELLRSNSVARRQQRSDNRAFLKGLLFDERGNRMSPSFTSKRGVRYRFYVSSAILTARSNQPASVRRIPAPELEKTIVAALRERFAQSGEVADQELIARHIGRIVLSEEKILITLKGDEIIPVELIRAPSRASSRARIETDQPDAGAEPDLSFVQAIARAHAWRRALASGAYQSIEELAGAVQWNAKVIRKALRLAFLAPDITEAIIRGSQPATLRLSTLQGVSTYDWNEQRGLLGLTNGQSPSLQKIIAGERSARQSN
ncbi:MAG: recombinase family protein [Pseudolabrys sp.]